MDAANVTSYFEVKVLLFIFLFVSLFVFVCCLFVCLGFLFCFVNFSEHSCALEMALWCKGYHQNTWQLPLSPLFLKQAWNLSTQPTFPLPHKISLKAVYIGHYLLQKSSCTRQRSSHPPCGRLSPPGTGSECPVCHCTWSLLQGVIFCFLFHIFLVLSGSWNVSGLSFSLFPWSIWSYVFKMR